ncbi:SDR family oxidoreductase [Tabrizicola fusiformis]|uniref:SDR family oxidoreductase n=1 Tax=Tabrizicola sp. SY72 TaxID=2741673 RepID=UPI001574588E|nr:SDR family oxidoreductase [Tabrizicola sp. SY72]NTT85986.1 SDR family oxidoreductase [Tabrizicola sp. SY72]
MTIAITGATGQLGRLAIAALKTRAPGAEVIALARNAAADLGVPVRAFDYTKPETLVPALAGVETLVLISSSDFNDRAGQHKAVIDAAKAAGVGRIVYTSLLKGDASPMILAQDHIATEAYLAASGLAHTVLRNGWYTENHTGSLGGAIAAGAMIGASGEGRIASAARADYAEAIAVTALDATHAGKVYELVGDAAPTMTEFAAEVGRQIGKPLPYNDLPPATYAGILQSFGLPEGFANILADSDVQASKGALFDDSRTLSALIGRPTTPIAATIAAALAG